MSAINRPGSSGIRVEDVDDLINEEGESHRKQSATSYSTGSRKEAMLKKLLEQ